MKTYTITKEDINCNREFVACDLSNYDGNIICEMNLGIIKFKNIFATGFIYFQAGSGIESENSAIAGKSLEVCSGIEVEKNIYAKRSIKSRGTMTAKEGSILSDTLIDTTGALIAGKDIVGKKGIRADFEIEAGNKIKSGKSLHSGLWIKSKKIYVKQRIFAGLCSWKKPTDEEKTIHGEIKEGTVEYGIYNGCVHEPHKISNEVKRREKRKDKVVIISIMLLMTIIIIGIFLLS